MKPHDDPNTVYCSDARVCACNKSACPSRSVMVLVAICFLLCQNRLSCNRALRAQTTCLHLLIPWMLLRFCRSQMTFSHRQSICVHAATMLSACQTTLVMLLTITLSPAVTVSVRTTVQYTRLDSAGVSAFLEPINQSVNHYVSVRLKEIELKHKNR